MSKFIYMAGLIDGEGTVGITKDSGKFRIPYISVSTTTPEIASWLKENFGGIVCNQKVYKAHHKQSYSWRLRNIPQVFALLEQILPYMLEPDKIRRGTLLLSEYKLVTPRNGKYSNEMLERKKDFESRFLSR